MNDFQPTPDLLDNFNVIDVVAHSISSQFAYNSKELAQRQARAAIDKLCDILEAAMNNPKDPFVPDGATVVNCMRLIARTPSEYLSV
jgi:alcohol dehydrogenase class IV